jgi:hypothetical protein
MPAYFGLGFGAAEALQSRYQTIYKPSPAVRIILPYQTTAEQNTVAILRRSYVLTPNMGIAVLL